MDFEWDENKRQKTLLQRGIDFIDAARPANKKEIQAYETRTFKQGLAL